MAIQFEVYTDMDIAAYMVEKFGEAEFTVVSKREYTYTKNVSYTILGFEGKVVSVRHCNFGYYDDYRPGADCIVKTSKGFVTVPVGLETIGNFGKVDASAEIINEYNQHLAYLARKREVQKRLDDRKKYIELSRQMGFDCYHIAKKLHSGVPDYFYEAVKLVATFRKGNIRSAFRASLAAQILNWLLDNEPKYKSPLSPKQMGFLAPRKFY